MGASMAVGTFNWLYCRVHACQRCGSLRYSIKMLGVWNIETGSFPPRSPFIDLHRLFSSVVLATAFVWQLCRWMPHVMDWGSSLYHLQGEFLAPSGESQVEKARFGSTGSFVLGL